ncbi:neutral/alkaline non-lysosomal ceramidase N-terminal domain-containing protein [Petrachloros mirabilis]
MAGYGGGARRRWLSSQTPYAYYLAASEGVHDSVRSKALVLQFDGNKLALVSVDLVIPSAAMHRDLARRLRDIGLDESSIILAATHTHSGPGSYVKNFVLELFALDRYVPEVWERMTSAIERSIRAAHARLAPARLAIGTRSISGVTVNRRRKSALDSLMTIIRIDSFDGKPAATVIDFPIHPTMMGPNNLLLSADLPGAIEHALESYSGGAALFINGAEGDVTPSGPRGDFRLVDQLGRRIAEEAFTLWKSLSPSIPASYRARQVPIDLGKASLNLWPCLKLDAGSGKWWAPALSGWPAVTTLTGFVIDGHAFVAVPGEPAVSIGNDIREQGSRAGFTSTSVIGLSNEYVGYILPKEEYFKGGYEACVSFYGPSLGDNILRTSGRLMEELDLR